MLQPSPSNLLLHTMSTVSEMSDVSDGGEGSPVSSVCSNASNAEPSCSSSSSSPLSPNDICRDFLRNVCKRGKRCKFRHPEGDEARQLGRRQDFTFCHDFQNSGCRRANCRFIHCTRDEEDYYKQTGQLPVRLQQAAALGIGVVPSELPLMKGEVPICKDFLKGECKRGARCKFRHLTAAQYDLELRRAAADPVAVRAPLVAAPPPALPTLTPITQVPAPAPQPTALEMETAFHEDYILERYEPPPQYENTLKRKRTAEDVLSVEEIHYTCVPRSVGGLTDYRLLEEENSLLRRKVEELKKQVSDLVATNEVLLEQNARYRTVKVVTTVSQPPTMTSAIAVAPRTAPMPPIAAAQPINPLSTTVNTLSGQLRLEVPNSAADLVVSQQALQTRLAPPDLPQATNLAAAITPAVSVSMNTLVPVSLSLDSIAPPPPGSIAPVSLVDTLSVGSLAQTSTLPGIMGSGAIANTATLVSYPIMSHSLTQATHVPNVTLG